VVLGGLIREQFVLGLPPGPLVHASHAPTGLTGSAGAGGLGHGQLHASDLLPAVPWAGFGVLCGYTALALGLAVVVLSRRDA